MIKITSIEQLENLDLVPATKKDRKIIKTLIKQDNCYFEQFTQKIFTKSGIYKADVVNSYFR